MAEHPETAGEDGKYLPLLSFSLASHEDYGENGVDFKIKEIWQANLTAASPFSYTYPA